MIDLLQYVLVPVAEGEIDMMFHKLLNCSIMHKINYQMQLEIYIINVAK